MRILVVLADHRWDKRIENDFAALETAGHHIHVLANAAPDRKREEVQGNVWTYRWLEPGSFPRRKLDNVPFRLTAHMPAIERTLPVLIDQCRPDCLVPIDLPPCLSTLRIGRDRALPVVALLFEVFPYLIQEWREIAGWQGFKNRFLLGLRRWQKLERRVIHDADYVIVHSQAIADLYRPWADHPGNIRVVEHTVALEEFDRLQARVTPTAPPKPAPFVIGYAGGLYPRRGVEVAIRGMVPILKHCPDAKLVIAGGGPAEPQIRKLASDLGVQSAVLFSGWQTYEVLRTLMTNFDVCVMAQERTPHNEVVLAAKVFEYMASACPQVVSDCRETARFVRLTDSGLVFRAGDIDDYACKVLELWRDPALRRRLGDNGRRAVEEQYQWRFTARKLCAVFEEIRAGERTTGSTPDPVP